MLLCTSSQSRLAGAELPRRSGAPPCQHSLPPAPPAQLGREPASPTTTTPVLVSPAVAAHHVMCKRQLQCSVVQNLENSAGSDPPPGSYSTSTACAADEQGLFRWGGCTQPGLSWGMGGVLRGYPTTRSPVTAEHRSSK